MPSKAPRLRKMLVPTFDHHTSALSAARSLALVVFELSLRKRRDKTHPHRNKTQQCLLDSIEALLVALANRLYGLI